MDDFIRRIDLTRARAEEVREFLRREWLITNGLGGYASATLSGAVTRRYHGMLIAALPSPLGRVVMLNHLAEFLRYPDGQVRQFGGEEPDPRVALASHPHYLVEFRLENQLPTWRYDIEGIRLEKRVLLVHAQNTVHVTYSVLSTQDTLWLEIQPSVHFRRHEQAVSAPMEHEYVLSMRAGRYEVSAHPEVPPLRLWLQGEGVSFTYNGGVPWEIGYTREAERGYESRGVLWSLGRFRVAVGPRHAVTLIASTEDWDTMLALGPAEAVYYHHERRRRLVRTAHPQAHQSPAADLVLAADQFIITPVGRVADAARAHAAGDEVRTVLAGYHWFTDWGRDTMISLEGLTLTTGRYMEAGWILRTFAHYIRHGLIPNMFPEGKNEGLYHTADATLWFFHALERYVAYTQDRRTLQLLLPALLDIAQAHLRGTRFEIAVDPRDGLLSQGEAGYQLTWMDAKVDDWVVTPRRGKAVEINALWYNALRLLASWVGAEQGEDAARPWVQHAQRVYASFNQRFWYAAGGYLFDVIDGDDGDDAACRPNQIFAIALSHAVLDQQYWQPVIEVVRERLLTPVGLRSLSREHPDYKPEYFGDLRARDAAYHQGTVWAWLIGPFIDAWLKVYPEDRPGVRRWLEGFVPHLQEACIGSMSEIFDAEAPFVPRGCVAQAWSVSEVLRCWIKTAD